MMRASNARVAARGLSKPGASEPADARTSAGAPSAAEADVWVLARAGGRTGLPRMATAAALSTSGTDTAAVVQELQLHTRAHPAALRGSAHLQVAASQVSPPVPVGEGGRRHLPSVGVACTGELTWLSRRPLAAFAVPRCPDAGQPSRPPGELRGRRFSKRIFRFADRAARLMWDGDAVNSPGW
jgi:hypothetical protein